MVRFSKKMIYALEAVVDIAYHAGIDPVQSRDITRRQGIPQRYLEQVMQRLVHTGILKGVRGPRGGYHLARERRRVSVADIAKVVYEIESGDDIMENGKASALAEKVVRPIWRNLREELMSQLENVTIEDLCRQAMEQGVRSDKSESAEYSI
jgi:Rrf2 family protein